VQWPTTAPPASRDWWARRIGSLLLLLRMGFAVPSDASTADTPSAPPGARLVSIPDLEIQDGLVQSTGSD